jgi:hypothetical protein
MCKHHFGVQLLQNPPFCSITYKTDLKGGEGLSIDLEVMKMRLKGGLQETNTRRCRANLTVV